MFRKMSHLNLEPSSFFLQLLRDFWSILYFVTVYISHWYLHTRKYYGPRKQAGPQRKLQTSYFCEWRSQADPKNLKNVRQYFMGAGKSITPSPSPRLPKFLGRFLQTQSLRHQIPTTYNGKISIFELFDPDENLIISQLRIGGDPRLFFFGGGAGVGRRYSRCKIYNNIL